MLLLDEPLIGLDAIAKKQLFGELLALVKDGEHTVFISSHGLSEIERFADHIGIIHLGKLLVEGPMDTVCDRFRLLDFVFEGQFDFSKLEGLRVQQRDGRFNRVLVDRSSDAMTRIKEFGVKEISEAPLSLEDLFVALVEEQATTRRT